MKKALSVSALVAAILFVVSCHKNNSSGYPSFGPSSLFPLQQGNIWYYQDSTFTDSTGFQATYLDTTTLTSQVLQDPSGLFFVGINDPKGWFQTGGYVSVDPYNTTIYGLDSTNGSPYIFFGTVNQDGTQIGSGTDYTNPTCPLTSTLVGFASTFMIGNYSCLKNIQYNVNCNNITQEIIVTYVSPGVGVVRIEDYLYNPSNTSAPPYLDYSQTLISAKINGVAVNN